MCYHLSFDVKLESIQDYFPEVVLDNQLDINFPVASYINGFDHHMHPVLRTSSKDGKKHLGLSMWGFLPNGVKNYNEAERFWNGYKDESGKFNKGFVTLNATGDDLLEKKLYKDAAINRRCIVFADGFYEWHHTFLIGKKGQPLKTAVKYPHHIYLKDKNQSLFMLAAIWSLWKHEEVDKETGELQTITTPTFAVVTTKANSLMSKIHNSKERMPTILTKELAVEWITPDISEERIKEIATFQFPAEQMGAHTISKDFQQVTTPKSRHNYPEFAQEFC